MGMTQLNKFSDNINWEMEFHSENLEQYHGEFCEIYSEGVRTWLPLAVNREGRIKMGDMVQ